MAGHTKHLADFSSGRVEEGLRFPSATMDLVEVHTYILQVACLYLLYAYLTRVCFDFLINTSI